MNGRKGQLDQSFKATWVNNLGIVSRNQKISSLAPGQIGVFPAYTTDGSEPVSLNVVNFKNHKRLVLKQGIRSSLGSKNSLITRANNFPRTSIEFTKEDILDWRGVKGQRGSVGDIIALGYDGLDASKDIGKGVKLDAKPLYINLRFSGEPIKRFFGKNYVDHRIMVPKGLCLGDCDCYDNCQGVDGNKIADFVLEYFDKESLFVEGFKGNSLLRVPLTQLVKVHKVRKCAEDVEIPSVATTTYKKWSIQIPATIPSAQAKLALANPTLQIEAETTDGNFVTYTAWTANSVLSLNPVTFTDILLPVCDTCPDCPVESTKVEGVKNVQIRVPHGAEVPTVTDGETEPETLDLAPAALISSDIFDGDVYLLKLPKTVEDADILAELGEDAIVEIIGDESTYCTGATQTFDWAQCEVQYTTTKQIQIVVPNHHCDKSADRLEDLQKAFPELSISIRQEGTCITSYQATIESEKLPAEDCDREFGIFKYKFPASFEGYRWTDVKPVREEPVCEPEEAEEKPCCVTGLIFETARWDEGYTSCNFGYTQYDPTVTKPVRLQVNMHQLDYSNNPCDEFHNYSTVLQKATYEKGTDGRFVKDMERIQLTYENNVGWQFNPAINEAFGYVTEAVEQEIYDVYYLTLRRPVSYGESHAWKYQNTITYIIPVISGHGKALESLINELVLSTGNKDLKAVIL